MTVLELMIVVSLIATLAGILAFAIGSIRDKVWRSQAEQDLQRLAAAIDQLAFDTGQWPGHSPRNASNTMVGSTLDEVMDLTTAYAGLITADVTYSNRGWKGPYLTSIPSDPWGRPYFFDPDYRDPTQNFYKAVVGSCGPKYSGRNDWEADNIYVEVVPKLK